ncbi:amidohydrolase family protein [Tsukamurella soli]
MGSDIRYIRARRIYAGGGAAPLSDAALVLDGPRVAGVVPAAQAASMGTEIAHYPDGTVLPGLIDAHCHLTLAGDGRSYAQMATDSDALMALISLRNMQKHLSSGVTTLRDNGGRNTITFAVRDAIERGYVYGPRLLLAGRPVTHTRGHFHWCNGVADGAEEIRRAVRELVADGADHIKIMASGGGTAGTLPYLPSYTVAEMATAVQTAHSLGTPTTAHCRAKAAVENAVDAGLDCIEHYEFLVRDPTAPYAGATSGSRIDYDPRVTQKVIDRGTYVSFTMQAGYGTLLELRHRDPALLTARDVADRDVLELYFDAKIALFSNLLRDGLLPQIVISSDSGCGADEFGSLHRGMELAVQGGMTTTQAIDSVTCIAAKAAHVDDVVGTLSAGKRADIVVIKGDPFADIAQMRHVEAVYRDGTEVPRDAHQASLLFAAATAARL